MNHLRKLEFRLGSANLVLEVPPFYVDFEKRNFGSIMARRNLPREGLVIYIYVTRRRHVENLLLLKKMHPDIIVPDELRNSQRLMRLNRKS